MNECVVCSEGGDGLVQVTERGKASLVEFSQLQQNDSVLIRVQNSEIVFVHEKCRKWYNNRKRINAVAKNDNEEEWVPKAKTRKSEDSFSWATDCFHVWRGNQGKDRNLAPSSDLRDKKFNLETVFRKA